MSETRIQGSGVPGTRQVSDRRQLNAGSGTRPAASGLATKYDHCVALTKEGAKCSAPNLTGDKYCVGHRRQKGPDR